MEQHTAKRLRYSFLFLLPAIVLLIFVIFVQSQIIFGQAEDMMGETPKEIITECGENELATLGANGLRCVKAERAPTTKDINITTTSCPFGIKNFNIDSSRTLSYTCVEPSVCGENQFLSAQAGQAGQGGPTFTCIGYDIPILKDKFCPPDNKISGFDEEGVPICTPLTNPLVGIRCPEGEYLKGVGEHSLYMIGKSSDSLYVLNTEATESPATKIGRSFSSRETTPVSITSHNGKLYMVGSSSDSLYELDPTGRITARIIGTSFGGVETTPVSITSHNGKLYMVGRSSDSLYELDPTGRITARIIGTSFGDGDGGSNQELTPRSITSHNGKLYMVGSGSDSLYVLDTEARGESPATKIGRNFGFPPPVRSGLQEESGRQEGSPTSITSHNGKLYMVGSGSDSLYVLDTEARSESPATKIGIRFAGEGSPVSITSHRGKLYMVGSGRDLLYELNTEARGDPATLTARSIVGGGENPATIIGTGFGSVGGSRQESSPTSITSLSIATRDPICVNF